MQRLVAMAPPPGSFGMQTSELFLPGSLSLGQKSSEALCPTPTLQPWALRTSLSLIRNLVKTHQGCFFLPTPVVFGTAAGDPPYKHVGTIQPGSGSSQNGWVWPGFRGPDQQGRILTGWELPGLAWQGHRWTLVKKNAPHEAGEIELACLRPELY